MHESLIERLNLLPHITIGRIHPEERLLKLEKNIEICNHFEPMFEHHMSGKFANMPVPNLCKSHTSLPTPNIELVTLKWCRKHTLVKIYLETHHIYLNNRTMDPAHMCERPIH